MKVRIPALLAAVTLIAVACGGTTASPSASTAASVAPPPSTAASEAPSTAPSAAAGPTTLRVSRISDFLPSIHPVELGTGNQELMADIVFSTLVDVDKDEVTILPDLAQTWDVTPDATTYTFHLNPAAVWSDGQPVTADDVLWTIAWSAQNPDAFKQIPVSAYLEVKGAADVKGTTNTPVGAEKIDDQHRQAHARGSGLDLPPPPRRRGLLHPAEAQAGRPDRRAGGDLPVLPRAPSARRSAPARTTSRSRSRPVARRSRPRRTTGRARTRRSIPWSTRSRNRTCRSPSSPRVSST